MILTFFGVGSFVTATVYRDLQMNTSFRPVDENEAKVSEVILERSLASKQLIDKNAAKVLNVPMSDDNMQLINGTWTLFRIVKANQLTAFDKTQNAEEAQTTINIELELVNNGLVMLDKNPNIIYKISVLNNDKMAIFKELNDGYEIIELRKKSAAIKSNISNGKIIFVEESLDYSLNTATNPQGKLVSKEELNGQVTIAGQKLSELDVNIENKVLSVEMIEIKNGGAFTAMANGEEVSGLVMMSESDLRISFTTGELKGYVLSFMTDTRIEADNSLDTARQEADANSERDIPVISEVAEATGDFAREREIGNNQAQAVSGQALSTEEISDIAATQGYSF